MDVLSFINPAVMSPLVSPLGNVIDLMALLFITILLPFTWTFVWVVFVPFRRLRQTSG